MVTDSELRQAMLMANRGGTVRVPLATQAQLSSPVFSVTLPDGATSPFVVVASGLIVNERNINVGITAPAALQLDMGFGNVLVTALCDLPVAGTIIQTPPCTLLRVTGIVNAPPVDVSAFWNVYAADGVVDAPPAMLTSPPKTIAAAATSAFIRPSLAVAYRIVLADFDPGDTQATLTQRNGTGVVSVDRTFAGGTVGYDWRTLHPLATEVAYFNTGAATVSASVQWQLQLGPRF